MIGFFDALKHAFLNEREGEINIAFRSTGDTVELTVGDNGVDVAEDLDWSPN